MRTKNKIRAPWREAEWTDEIHGLTGTMKPAEAIARLDKWERENDPEEDAAVLKALEEEFAEPRRVT